MNSYTHKHHIVPKHIGGTDDPSNLIELTVEDHAIAHKVLYHLWKREEDKIAWLVLSGQIGAEEAHKMAVKNGMSDPGVRARISKSRIGKKMSEETKKTISDKLKGRTNSEQHNNKIRDSLKGKPHTEERKNNVRIKTQEAMNRPEVRAKLRKPKSTTVNMKKSPEARAKISAFNKLHGTWKQNFHKGV